MQVGDNTPGWVMAIVASIVALVGAAYVVVKLAFHVQDRLAESAAKKADAERDKKRKDEEVSAESERTTTAEVWQVVDRLQKQIEEQREIFDAQKKRWDEIKEMIENREQEARERATKCEAEHAGTRAMLRLVIAFAKKKGMVVPLEMESQLRDSLPDPSGTHRVPSSFQQPEEGK